MQDLATYVTAGFSGVTTVIVAMAGWGWKGQRAALHNEIQAGLAAAENRFFQRVNGNYVRKEVLDLKLENALHACEQCKHQFEPRGEPRR